MSANTITLLLILIVLILGFLAVVILVTVKALKEDVREGKLSPKEARKKGLKKFFEFLGGILTPFIFPFLYFAQRGKGLHRFLIIGIIMLSLIFLTFFLTVFVVGYISKRREKLQQNEHVNTWEKGQKRWKTWIPEMKKR